MRGQDLWGHLTHQCDHKRQHHAAQYHTAGATDDLSSEDSPHRSGNNHGEVLKQDDEREETLLARLEPLDRLRRRAPLLRQVPHPETVHGDHRDLHAVHDRVGDDPDDQDDGCEFRETPLIWPSWAASSGEALV